MADATERVREMLRETGALLSGHFLLASGLHSDTYVQCALVLQHPPFADELCTLLAEKWDDENIDSVCGPALGGVVIGYELARRLGVRGFFTERKDGVMALRRGFTMAPLERVLIAEDVVTTGGSALETAELLESHGATVVGLTSLVDRGKASDMPFPFRALLSVSPPVYTPEECPMCATGGTAVKPGGAKRRSA